MSVVWTVYSSVVVLEHEKDDSSVEKSVYWWVEE
jgi:hypothetical protein